MTGFFPDLISKNYLHFPSYYYMMTNKEKLRRAAEIIMQSDNIVIFTGAGVSTESGIADFRSEGGLWSRYDPGIYANYYSFLKDPSPFWEMHTELLEILLNARPNPAHFAIAKLEEMGKVSAIITQNIDMLHQRAGSGKEGAKIYELHGAYGTMSCVECSQKFKYDEFDNTSMKFPICDCGGYIKPDVVLFGEVLPRDVLIEAMNVAKNCDLLIMVGSSLTVSPANFMPSIAKEQGAKVIYINRESTIMDNLADLILRGSAGEIFTELMILLEKE